MSLNDSAFGRILAMPSGWFSRLLHPWDRVAKPGTASIVPSSNPRLMIKPVRPQHTASTNLTNDSLATISSPKRTSDLDPHYSDYYYATSVPKRRRVKEDLGPGLTVFDLPTNLRPMEFEVELAYSMAIKELAEHPEHLDRPKRTLHGELVEDDTALHYRSGSMYLLADSRQPRTRLAEAGRPALSDIASEPTQSSPATRDSPQVFAVPSVTASERCASISASLVMTPAKMDSGLDVAVSPSPLAGPIHVPGNDIFHDTRQNTAVNKLAHLVDTQCDGAATKGSTVLTDDRGVVRVKLPAEHLDYMPQNARVVEPFTKASAAREERDGTVHDTNSPLVGSPMHENITLTVTDFSPIPTVTPSAAVEDDTFVVPDFSPYGCGVSPHQEQAQAVDSTLPQEVVEAPSTPITLDTQPEPQPIELPAQIPRTAVGTPALDSPGRDYLRAFISKSRPSIARIPLGEKSPNASPSPPKRKQEEKPRHDEEQSKNAKKPRAMKVAPATPSKVPPRRSVRARAQSGAAAAPKSAIPAPIKVGKAPSLNIMRTEQAELARRTSANTRKNRGKAESLDIVQARYLEAGSMSPPSESGEPGRTNIKGVVWKEPLEEAAPAIKAAAAAKKAATPKPKKAKKVAVAPARPGTPRVTRSRTRSQMV